MKREIVEVPGISHVAREWGIPLSHVTRGAGMIFVSGTPPIDVATGELIKGDIEVQTEAALQAVRHCLAAAGASFDDVLMVRIYLANVGFYKAVNRVYARHFPANPPARTVVPVAGWPMEFDLEIEVIAAG
ncbi:MAG TPA: RidA family protein [Mesorhizobium sp.]